MEAGHRTAAREMRKTFIVRLLLRDMWLNLQRQAARFRRLCQRMWMAGRFVMGRRREWRMKRRILR